MTECTDLKARLHEATSLLIISDASMYRALCESALARAGGKEETK